MISLTAEDAKNRGIDIISLNYNFPLSTANGTSYGARIRLASIAVGPIVLADVDAVISKEGSSDISLLGMSFLGRLKQFLIKGNTLTLVN
jgi:aspartyl protease family protein